VAVEGKVLRVRGVDAMDRTPVLDIKPWLDEFGRSAKPVSRTGQAS